MSVSTTFQHAINAPVTDEVVLFLLQIDHDSLSEPIRVVDNFENVTSNGDVYIAFGFRIQLPDDSNTTQPRPILEIDNVDRAIYDAVRAMETVADVTLSVILASDPDTIEVGPITMKLRKVETDVLTVRGELAFEELWAEPYPGDKINPNNYPGLF